VDLQPFEPEIRDGKIWGRGADDDKGQGMMHAKAFELMVKTGTLPCNVKFMIEGREEIGSPNLGKWCKNNREMLKADVILVSDTSMIAAGYSFHYHRLTGTGILAGGSNRSPTVIFIQVFWRYSGQPYKCAVFND
jgi:acetylornithine deacetylase/succinyl-diaminopimelate desuccinylase-like protein